MRNTLIIILLFIIFGCKSEKKELPTEFLNSEEFQIEFLQKKVRLPDNYIKTSIEEVFAKMDKFENPDSFYELQYSRLNMLLNNNAEFEIFEEKDNFTNTISFMLGEYILLNESVLNTYVDLLESRIIPKSSEFGFEYKRIESKFIKYNSTKIIKLKYEQKFDNNKRFTTQYLITYGMKTFSIIVVNDDNIDYEFIIKNFA